MEEGLWPKCEIQTHLHTTCVVFSITMSICLCHINQCSPMEREQTQRCAFLCTSLYMYVTVQEFFHISIYHVQFCMHESADVMMLMMIMMMVFIYLEQWKKVDGV